MACRLFEAAVERGKIANAYLLVGSPEADKLLFAREAACYFNCQRRGENQGDSCLLQTGADGYCLHCQWISQGEHPQAWLVLAGEGKSGKIPVEKARALTDELSKTSPFVRVAVVNQADDVTFHRPAANALLKCIEEPPPDVLFFFFAGSAEDVLATIVSRCQSVPFTRAMPMGYIGACDNTEIKAKMDTARSEFVMNARKQFGSRAAGDHYFKTVTEGLALSRQLQELCKELQEVMDESSAAHEILDFFLSTELEVLKDSAASNPACGRYLQRLVELVERTKRHINQYVKQSNAIETFGLSLIDLRQSFSGEVSLAKR